MTHPQFGGLFNQPVKPVSLGDRCRQNNNGLNGPVESRTHRPQFDITLPNCRDLTGHDQTVAVKDIDLVVVFQAEDVNQVMEFRLRKVNRSILHQVR